MNGTYKVFTGNIMRLDEPTLLETVKSFFVNALIPENTQNPALWGMIGVVVLPLCVLLFLLAMYTIYWYIFIKIDVPYRVSMFFRKRNIRPKWWIVNFIKPISKDIYKQRLFIEEYVTEKCREIEESEGPIEFWLDFSWRVGLPPEADNYYVFLPRFNRKDEPRGHVYKKGDPDHEYAKELRFAILEKFYYIMNRRFHTRIIVSYKAGYCWSLVS